MELKKDEQLNNKILAYVIKKVFILIAKRLALLACLTLLTFVFMRSSWLVKIITILILYILIVFLLNFRSRILERNKETRLLKKLILQAEILSPNIGNVINFAGKKGSGKTTGASGFITLFSALFCYKIKEQLNMIKLYQSKIDFNKLDMRIEETIKNITLKEFDTYSDLIFDAIKDEYKNVKQLKQYVYYYCRLYFPRFIYSNIKHYNHFTGELAIMADSDNLKIKNSTFKSFIFPHDYFIYFNDDILLEQLNIHANKKDREDDDGRIACLRIWRHMFKEKGYMVTTAQSFDDLPAKDRKLFDYNFQTIGFNLTDFDFKKYLMYKLFFKVVKTILQFRVRLYTLFRKKEDIIVKVGKDLYAKKTKAQYLLDSPYNFVNNKRLLEKLDKAIIKITDNCVLEYYYDLENITSDGVRKIEDRIKIKYLRKWCFSAMERFQYGCITTALICCSEQTYDNIDDRADNNNMKIVNRVMTKRVQEKVKEVKQEEENLGGLF